MKLQRLFGAICAVLMFAAPARATEQSTYVMPTTGPMNMATYSAGLNSGLRALASCSWGPSAPVNGPSAAALPYQCWADTTSNPVVFKYWDGTSWVVAAKLNTSSHLWTPVYQGTDLSTASTATTGTSGHTLGFLDGANTWSAFQTAQGSTGTGPGWYVQLPGDTTPRVRVGLDGLDVGSLQMGPGNAVRDTFLRRFAAATWQFGNADAAAPVAQTIGVQNVVAGTSNTAGAAWTFQASRGTGTGAGGKIVFQVAPAGSSGSAQNAFINALSIWGTGGLTTGTLTDFGAGSLNVTAFYANNKLIVDSSGNLTATNGTFTGPVSLGANGGSAGQIVAYGSTSGNATVSAQAAAGTPALFWPTIGGTLASSATSPIVVSAAGQISCPTCNTTGANVSSVTAGDGSLTVSPTAGNVVASVGLVPLGKGGSGQTTAPAARGSSGFNIDQLTSTGDANYTIASTDRAVYHTALSVARTDTLPAANSVNAGQEFHILDFAGVASGTKTVTLQRAGSDTINGVTSVVAINAQYGAGIFWSDGVSRWTFQPQSAGGAGTVTQVSPGNGLVSSLTASCSQTPITTSGTLSAAECVNAQSGTSYTIVDGDRAKLITASNAAAQAYSIAQAGASSAFQSGWYVDIRNNSTNGAGIVTVTPTTSTINGAASFAINPGQSVRIVSDGTNYQTVLSHASGSALNGTPSNPSSTTNTTGVMMGLGGTWKLTPAYGGKIVITIDGYMQGTTSVGAQIQGVRYGTGPAPTNGAALTGTVIGANPSVTNFSTSSNFSVLSLTRVITGLSAGTAYWFDVGLAPTSAGTASIGSLTVTAYEIP